MIKLSILFYFITGLMLINSAYASNVKPELSIKDIEKAYQELKVSDGDEVAKAFLEEVKVEAVKGNIMIAQAKKKEGPDEYDKLKAALEGKSKNLLLAQAKKESPSKNPPLSP